MERPAFRRMIQPAKDDSKGDPDRQSPSPRDEMTKDEGRMISDASHF